MSERYEAVVIGTGFGGAISACRLSKRWPGNGKVLVLERGKRYPLGSFPRKPHDVADSFWNVSEESHQRPREFAGREMHGLFDIRSFRQMDVVLGAGLGGGSLIYANVFLEPPDHVFDDRWPNSCKKAALAPYYRMVKEVLGSRPIPQNGDPRRRILRTELFQQFAREVGRPFQLVDINVFFGNDLQNPLPIGEQQRNRYGALQTSCVYCGECDIGCNYQAKNTLDLNYLFVAEHRYGAEIRTEHLANRIVPLDKAGDDDPSCDGTHGFAVYVRDLNGGSAHERVVTQRVVVSAGTLGSNEILLRCRDVHRTLPRLSRRLGHSYSGNGDFLSFVVGTNKPADPTYGPVITQRTDFNLFDAFDPSRAFILEDASYPALAAWFTEGAKPGFLHLNSVMRIVRDFFRRFLRGESLGSVGTAFKELLSHDLSYHTAVLLCMGIDQSNGVMTLDRRGQLDVDWPQNDSRSLYEAMLQAGRSFKEVFSADAFVPLPNWLWPFRKNVSVHSLGGCILADTADGGVTSADRATFGRVFGYQNLYVADGAIVPTAVGANPTATISALAEMVAQAITGIQPDADL
jgi:cholesterol oxidase